MRDPALEIKSLTRVFRNANCCEGSTSRSRREAATCSAGDNVAVRRHCCACVAGLEAANGGMLRFEGAAVDLGHYPEALRPS